MQITGTKFEEMLKKAKLTKTEVAKAAGVSRSTLLTWINDKKQTRRSVIARLLNAYEELKKK